MRRTYQREVILEELRKVKTHPSAAELYEMVRRRIPHLSFGTVYRNLKLLRDQRQVLELTLGAGASMWDGNAAPHYHFTCRSCGRVLDLPVAFQPDWQRQVEAATGFTVTDHRAEFYGLCLDCQGSISKRSETAPAQARRA